MVYECVCGRSNEELMPPRFCKPACEIEKTQLTIKLNRLCGECYKANNNILLELQCDFSKRSATSLHDKPLPGNPAPGPVEGLPPDYQEATEEPPTYACAIAAEEPASYDNVVTAIATFQSDDIVRAWHAFRTSQLSLLPPLFTELQALERRVSKAKRRLHRAEDVGFCEEVIIRLVPEQKTLDKSLQQGQRYFDATLVLKYGLDKYRAHAKESSKLGDYNQARSHVKAASEHADRLLEMKIQLLNPNSIHEDWLDTPDNSCSCSRRSFRLWKPGLPRGSGLCCKLQLVLTMVCTANLETRLAGIISNCFDCIVDKNRSTRE